MKTRKLIPLLLTIGLFAVAFMIPAFALSLIGGGALMAAATGGGIVEGTTTIEKVDATQPDLLLDYVDQKIVKMRPSAYPLDTIFRTEVKKVTDIKSIKTEFYAVDVKPFKDVTTAAFTNSGSQTSAELTVSNIAIWNKDDTVLVPSVKGSDGKNLVLCITSKTVGTQRITVQALNGTGAGTDVVPNIASGATLVRMAPAKSELDIQADPFSIMPAKDFNYCQNFITQIEASTFDKIHSKEVNWDFTDYEELGLYDLRARMEMSFIAGYRKRFADATDGDIKYTCHGISRYMTKGLQWNGTDGITNTTFVNWSKSIFADNSGSDTRVMLVGDDLMAALSLVPDIQKQLDSKSVEVVHGIKFNKIITNWGELRIKRHPMFRLMGMDNDGIVLDVANLQKHIFIPMSATTLDLKTSGQRNADAKVLQEVSCPVLRYPATHAMITKA